MLKGIPKKYHKYIKEAWRDSDGIWVQLKRGYIFAITLTTVVVQDTMQDLKIDLAEIRKASEDEMEMLGV